MLANLKIENVAVIEKAEVNFTHGFTVLTGETGAGKSILIDSINAILGNRTSRELVRSGAQKACIWATFEAIPASVKKQLEKCGYEASDDLLLYREINAEGKGSCRVNGMPATAAVVRDISSGLLSIHGQHDSQSLTNPALHLDLLDQYAQNRALFAEYYRRYRELVTVKRQLDALNASESDKQRRIEALTAEIEGSHVQIGVDVCRKYNENNEVIHAIEAHHNDVEPKTAIACIVQAADAISAARPAARSENYENYIKRLQKLESICASYEGVEKCYALQAGREIRVMVVPEVINDEKMVLVARQIAKQIETEMDYPGQIKVNLIRESRVVDYAK